MDLGPFGTLGPVGTFPLTLTTSSIMDLTNIILGPIVTEKSERLKAGERHVYTLRVAPAATKIDVKNALKKFYDLDVTSIRMVQVRAKTRMLGKGVPMEKRKAYKKALVTAAAKSKSLDLASLRAS